MTPELAKNLPEAFGAAHGWTAPGKEPRADCNGSSGLVGAGGVKALRVLVACECSGVVRNAFAALGHDAWSCDIVPSETPGNHLQCSVLDVKVVKRGWDLMIAHPDCTFLTVSGARWMSEEWREEAQLAALHFVKALWKFPVPRIAIENPVGRLSSLWRGPSQYIQPWQFGHGETKTTGLWLKGLSPLIATEIVEGREQRIFKMAPSETRKRDRSRTYEGIAKAMAFQWGGGGAELGERNGALKSGAVPPIDPKLSDRGVRRGTCMAGGKAAAEAGAVTHGAVRCSAWLAVAVAFIVR